MHKWCSKDNLHRTAKIALDTGEAKTLIEAEQIFSQYKLALKVGPDVAFSPTLQSIVLTAVNTGRRCFLGEVQVEGNLSVPLQVPWLGCRTLSEAIQNLQGKIVDKVLPGIPRIVVGDVSDSSEVGAFYVRATFDGWSGGVIPIEDGRRLSEQTEFIPSGVLAGALAVSEAFQFVRGENVLAGRRDVGLSLWRPAGKLPWIDNKDIGPQIDLLPSKIWIIGLGHLGQAFLWTLGLLPYACPKDVFLVLQDYDSLTEANDSTSPLTFHNLIGRKKTRAMAQWCEERGFHTSLYERPFAANFNVSGDEPRVAICGVDNPLARSDLEKVGFSRIIEAGLGKGPQEYLAFQMHTFPGPQKAQIKWLAGVQPEVIQNTIQQPAYQTLAYESVDQCGLTLLAGQTVGASFVGVVTSTLMISELIRMVHGEHGYALIDGSLRSLAHCQAILNLKNAAPFNPGATVIQQKWQQCFAL